VTNKTRVLIIDDHPLFREGIKTIISKDAQFEVVDEAGSAHDGLEKISQLKPDVAVVDISLPDGTGMEVARKIRSQSPRTRIMILSMHSKIDYIVEAFQAGATGYVVKESAAERLAQGLRSVAAGEYYLDSSISQEVVAKLMNSPVKEAKVSDSGYGKLTSREQEIMRLLAEGVPKAEVADQLCISIKTVENHRTNIMRKLDIHTAMDMVRYAARLGLIDVDLWKE
jgi:DNA-binding NarL/FixJ family response regulator